jgi:hypothetical protein
VSAEVSSGIQVDGLTIDHDAPASLRQVPFHPARFPVTRRLSKRAEATGWRRVAEDLQWYGTKWLRQMVFVALHPEDGFWELKRTGDWWSVAFMVTLLIAARGAVMGLMGFHFVFLAIDQSAWSLERALDLITRTLTFGMTPFLYGGNPEDTSILQEAIRIVIPFVTWCLAHYAISMIFFGEGSFRDICVSAGFSFGPYIVLAPLATLVLTNTMTLQERGLYMSLSWMTRGWVAYLFYTHMRVIHDFTAARTLATYAIGAATVIVIWALAALVFALSSNTWEFFYQVFYEVMTR